MLRLLYAMICLAISISTAATQSQGQSTVPPKDHVLPKSVVTTISELLVLSQKDFTSEPGKSWMEYSSQLTKAHAQFLVLLQTLDRQVSENLATKIVNSSTATIERNLIEMARNYGQHPEYYAQLVKYYEHPVMRDARVQRPPGLAAQHAVEKYRSTWELLLLAPSTHESRFMRRVCFQAIETIRNDASIPLLVRLYERANVGVQNGFRRNNALDEQMAVLKALNRYCDSAGLHAMLRCMAISERGPRPSLKLSGFTMKEWAVRLLGDRENYGNRKPWREVIEKVLQEKEKLSDADRSFLQDAFKNPAPN